MSFFKREPERKERSRSVAARQKAVDQVIREQAAKLNERLARREIGAPSQPPKQKRRGFMGGLLAWRNAEDRAPT
jgi:hypothetical protein